MLLLLNIPQIQLLHSNERYVLYFIVFTSSASAFPVHIISRIGPIPWTRVFTLPGLTRSAKLPTGIYILLALISFFNGDKLSQDPLDRFSRSLHQMIGICSNMTDLDLFFDSSRDVAMATN